MPLSLPAGLPPSDDWPVAELSALLADEPLLGELLAQCSGQDVEDPLEEPEPEEPAALAGVCAAGFGLRHRGGNFHLEPFRKLVLVAPNASHFRASVSRDHRIIDFRFWICDL